MSDPMQAALLERARRERARRQAQPDTNLVEQSMSGVNEGLAGVLGFPVDAMAGALNLGARGVNAVAGTDLPQIEKPAGGSEMLRELMAPVISDVDPQTKGQRYGRRIGQEVGAMAIPGGVMMRGAKAPLGLMAAETASAVGAGVGGQTARELAPNSDAADFAGSLLGGISPIAATRFARRAPQAPSLDELRGQQSDAYGVLDQSTATLTPQATQRLQANVANRAADDAMDPFLAPKASRVADRIGTLDQPTLSEVEKTRRLVGRDVAGALDPTEQAIGMGMKDEITDYLDNLTPQDVTGGDPAATVAAAREGRDVTRRIKKSEEIRNLIYKGENRAATSGTGGNEVNAIRQNIRSILDNPRKRRGYKPEEIAMMEQIVKGTPTQNALRLLGRLSPTAGALPGMLGGGMYSGAAATGNPLLAIPPTAGWAAKMAGELSTKRAVGKLDSVVRNGGPLAKKSATDTEKRALKALLIQRLISGSHS